MNIVILDDYQDAVRKLACASKLEEYPAKVYTNTIKGIGQLAVRLKDAEILVLIRERTHITRSLIEKLPRLKLISQTGNIDAGRGAKTASSAPPPIVTVSPFGAGVWSDTTYVPAAVRTACVRL